MEKTETKQNVTGGSQSEKQLIAKIPQALPNVKSFQGLTAWLAKPLPMVGSRISSLRSLGHVTDSAKKPSCKQQSYVSWDSYSRSYIVSYARQQIQGHHRRRREIQEEDDQVDEWDQPDPDDVERYGLSEAHLAMVRSGRLLFLKNYGIVKPSKKDTDEVVNARGERRVEKMAMKGKKGHIVKRQVNKKNEAVYNTLRKLADERISVNPNETTLYINPTTDTYDVFFMDYSKKYVAFVKTPFSGNSGRQHIEADINHILGKIGTYYTINSNENPYSFLTHLPGAVEEQRAIDIKHGLQSEPSILSDLDLVHSLNEQSAAYQLAQEQKEREAKKAKEEEEKKQKEQEEKNKKAETERKAEEEDKKKKETKRVAEAAEKKRQEDLAAAQRARDEILRSAPQSSTPSSSSSAPIPPSPEQLLRMNAQREADVARAAQHQARIATRHGNRRQQHAHGLGDWISINAPKTPVRTFVVDIWRTEYEERQEVQKTPLYNILQSRIADPDAGALASMIRGVAVRDGTSLLDLAKWLVKDQYSWMDIAPALRLGCMILSLAKYNYDTDPIFYRYSRKIEKRGQEYAWISRHQAQNSPQYRGIAMPLDIFIQHMGHQYTAANISQDQLYSYDQADQSWVAIPIDDRMINSQNIIPYIAAFLSSELWNGTVSYGYDAITKNQNNENIYNAAVETMPAVNSVYIPGAHNFILVLVDANALNRRTTVPLGGQQVPIFNGQNVIQNSINFNNIWNNFWNIPEGGANNVDPILKQCMGAMDEMQDRILVGNTSNLTSSILSEIYVAQYQGLGLEQINNDARYNYATPVHGGWADYAGNISNTCQIRLNNMNVTENNRPILERRLTGYGFSSISAMGMPAAGYAQIEFDETPGNLGYRWTTSVPGDNFNINYHVSSADSLTRVCIYVKMLQTSYENRWTTAESFAAWHHMLGGAIAAQTATALANNNIPLAIWTGYDNRFNTRMADSITSDFIRELTMGMVLRNEMENLHERFDIETDIMEYYGMEPYSNVQWMSYHPLPYPFILQWANKMSDVRGNEPSMTNVSIYGRDYEVFEVNEDTAFLRANMVCTIDIEGDFPLVTYTSGVEVHMSQLYAWIDNFSYLTLTASQTHGRTSLDYFSSQTFTLPKISYGLTTTNKPNIFIFNSRYQSRDENNRSAHVDTLKWPDPIDIEKMIEAAKNYVMNPALAAAAGYQAAGPLGALAGGGLALGQQIVKDIKNKNNQATAAVEEAAQKALENGPPIMLDIPTNPALTEVNNQVE